MKGKKSTATRLFYVVVLLCVALSSCAPATIADRAADSQALETEAAAPTQTPEPTNTSAPPTPTVTATATSTATPKPTATATPNHTATAEAQATAAADALLKKIEPELKEYNVNLADGHLAWSSDEKYVVTARTYDDYQYKELETAGKLTNFVYHTDITWDTTMGFAVCGMIFHADDDLKKGRLNYFGILRLENAPAWAIQFRQKSAYQYSLQNWVFTNSIFDKYGDTNAITLVVNGQNITPYINGRKTHLVEDTKLKEGRFGFMAYQESGETTCTFNNTWIWAIDKP